MAVTNDKGAWIPEVLLHCWPMEFQNVGIFVLEEFVDDIKRDMRIQVKMFICQHPEIDCDTTEIVMMRKNDSYTLLDMDITPILKSLSKNNFELFVMNCCDSLKSMAVKEIELPQINSSNMVTQAQMNCMWEKAIEMVDLTRDEKGRWTTTPPGLSGEKQFTDGSLQDSGWVEMKKQLRSRLAGDQVGIVDFGSEGGYCIAQFATDPLVKSVIGKEIQYPWVVYSSLILFHMYTQSKNQNTHFASIKLLCGSFLDLVDTTWMNAIANADVIHCDNWNWWKGNLDKKDSIIPQVKGFSDLQKSIDINVAYLLKRLVKDDAHIIVYKIEHFQVGFECLHSFNVHANWNSVGSTSIHMLKSNNDNTLQCETVTTFNSSKSPDETFLAKTFLPQNGFYCDCGMPLIRMGVLAAKDTYVCTTCEVRRLFSCVLYAV
jgi:hypothetical protein